MNILNEPDSAPGSSAAAEPATGETGEGTTEETGVPVETVVQPAEPAVEPAQAAEETEPLPIEEIQPEGEFDPDIGPPRVTKQGDKIEWHVPMEKGRMLYDAVARTRKYEEAAETPELAAEHADTYVATAKMHADLASGDPARAGYFFDYWTSKYPQGIGSIAGNMYDRLSASNPDAATAMRSNVVQRVAEEFYKQYASQPDKESDIAQKYLYGAQILDWMLTGSYTPPESIKPADLADERLADINRREAALQRSRNESIQASQNHFKSTTNAEIRKQFSAAIEAALKPIDHIKTDQPLVYKAAVNELRDAVASAIDADKRWTELFAIDYDAALKNLTPEGQAKLVSQYMARAKRSMGVLVAKVISGVGTSFKAKSAETHAKLSAVEAAGKKEVTGTAAHRAPTVTNKQYEEAAKNKDVAGAIKALLA